MFTRNKENSLGSRLKNVEEAVESTKNLPESVHTLQVDFLHSTKHVGQLETTLLDGFADFELKLKDLYSGYAEIVETLCHGLFFSCSSPDMDSVSWQCISGKVLKLCLK